MKLQGAALGIDPLDLRETDIGCCENRPHELRIAVERLFERTYVTAPQDDDVSGFGAVPSDHISLPEGLRRPCHVRRMDHAGRLRLAALDHAGHTRCATWGEPGA